MVGAESGWGQAMKDFSASAAIMAGFRLIQREPLAFLAWAVLYAILGLGPQLGTMGQSLAMMTAMGAGGDPQAFAAKAAPLQALQLVGMLSGLVAGTLVSAAIFRAVLRPEDRRFLYLRLGAGELWLGLTVIVMFVIYLVAVFAMALPILVVAVAAAVAGGSAGASGAGAGLLIAAPVFLIGFGVIVWGAVRLSVALPMSFAERNFRIPEAWKATKGHAGKIFGVALVLMLMFLALEALLGGAGFAALLSLGSMEDLSRSLAANPAALFARVNPLVWVLVAAIWAVFSTWSVTMLAAAWAEIYRALSGRPVLEVFD